MSNLSTFFLNCFLFLIGIGSLYFVVKKLHPTSFFKKLLRWVCILGLLIFSLITGYIAKVSYQNYIDYEKLVIPTGLDGIQLGWSYDEVLFRKGKPEKTSRDGEFEFIEYKNTLVEFDEKVAVKIIHYCGLYDSFPIISGVACDSPLSKIESIYGKSAEISSSEDSFSRIYNYPASKVAFILQESSVKAVIVFDNNKAPRGYQYLPKKKVKEKVEPKKTVEDKLPLKSENLSLDHCAMNLSKDERLRRLAMKGPVRETGLWQYSTKGHFLSFYTESGSQVANCW